MIVFVTRNDDYAERMAELDKTWEWFAGQKMFWS